MPLFTKGSALVAIAGITTLTLATWGSSPQTANAGQVAAVVNKQGEEFYFACYLKGTKIGWQSFRTSSVTRAGRAQDQSDSKTEMNLGLIGTPMEVKLDSQTWSEKGRPVEMIFKNQSAGRYQNLRAIFGEKTVKVEVDNNGTKTTETLTIPNNGKIVDDPIAEVVSGRVIPGSAASIWVLDPSTVAFVENKIKVLGKQSVVINDKSVEATAIEIWDPRVSSTVFINAKGDVLKVTSGLGIELVPATKAEALAASTETGPAPDLAEITAIRPTGKPLRSPQTLTSLKVRLVTPDLSRIPNDGFQTVVKDGKGWVINVNPKPIKTVKSVSISVAKGMKPDWIKPTLLIPAKSPKFIGLAKQIVGKRTDVKSAAMAIRQHVHKIMRPNAGIGVLRDATEVLAAKEGVCRDYAVLTATLCRAAGIPTRLVSGLVTWDGTFYYHAWVEVWTGSAWMGLDSIAPEDQISAGHIKLAEGNVNTAFTFSVLSGATMEILASK